MALNKASEALRMRIARMPQLSIAEITKRHPQISLYPAFCLQLVQRYPDRNFIFFERDALPLKWVTEELLGEAGRSRLHSIHLDRTMLPKALRDSLDAHTQVRAETYLERRQVIQRHVNSDANGQELSIPFVRQRLAGVPERAVLVDVGYWGTLPLFVEALMPEKHFEVALLFGPPGAPVFRESLRGPELEANSAENFFEFTTEAFGLSVDPDGLIRPQVIETPHKELRLAQQRAGLIELTRSLVKADLALR